ncbi:MAG: DUF1015 domain-containing protein [Chloroflexi bacterium]|nr:DUF1015 domain-containing protein [Chloroflexota bacterium]
MPEISRIGVAVPDLLLPKPDTDLKKWAVIACDQFTSQPEYWERVAEFVGNAPSTFHMILPEVWLESEDVQDRIDSIQKYMRQYLDQHIFETHPGFMLVERSVGDHTQTGLVVALDLETYDYNKGSTTLIRATEGTILDRLPPRMKVRRGAPIELPHILVLYDDPNWTVLKETLNQKESLQVKYDLDLMEGSGHITGRLVNQPELIASVMDALTDLIEPSAYAQKYSLPEGSNPLLFAMGDGNHSLATAKAIWEEIKPTVGMNHPSRYALVELVNLHDPSLQFEAIHRALFNVPSELLTGLKPALGELVKVWPAADLSALAAAVNDIQAQHQRFGVITPEGYQVYELLTPHHNLPVGNLQPYLDAFLKENPEVKIDYVHGDDVVDELGRKQGNVAFYLPAITKNSFFRSIILDGALPRKTFSMGHAKDKRFYMECRKIVP